MRKAKKEKMKLKCVRKMLNDPVMRFQMAVTNRAIILIKMGEPDNKVVNLMSAEQHELIKRIKEDLGDLGLTEKAFNELVLSDVELKEILVHAKEIIKEMEAKN